MAVVWAMPLSLSPLVLSVVPEAQHQDLQGNSLQGKFSGPTQSSEGGTQLSVFSSSLFKKKYMVKYAHNIKYTILTISKYTTQ